VETIKQALNAIDTGMTLGQAAKTYNIPKSTLHRKRYTDEALDCRKGPPTVLNSDEEKELANWILCCAEKGFPVTKDLILDYVQKIMVTQKRENPFKNNRPGRHWYVSFMTRHPILSNSVAQKLKLKEITSVTDEDLKKWFTNLQIDFEKKGLLNLNPERIFNIGISSFLLVPPYNPAIDEKVAKSANTIVKSNEKGCLRVLFTATASGNLLPPMILFDLKTVPKKNVMEKIPENWAVGNIENGLITSKSFYKYVTNVFFKHLKANNCEFPVILYVDGHSSLFSLPLIKFCAENKIELVKLCSNSTHILQPLDVGLLNPLKDAYKKVNKNWRIQNDVVDFKKSMFAPVLKLTLLSEDFSDHIINGFKTCGLSPFDPNAINYDILEKKKKRKADDSEFTETNLSSNSGSSKNIELLNIFENSILSPSMLHNFKVNEDSELWNGDITQSELFHSWKKIENVVY